MNERESQEYHKRWLRKRRWNTIPRLIARLIGKRDGYFNSGKSVLIESPNVYLAIEMVEWKYL